MPADASDLIAEVRRRAAARRRRRRGRIAGAAAVTAAVLAVVLPLTLTSGSGSTLRVVTPPSSLPATTRPGTSVPGAPTTVAPPTTSAVGATSTTRGTSPSEPSTTFANPSGQVPEIVCPTTMGSPVPPASPGSTTELNAPGADQLAVYTDSSQLLMVVAPRGWKCAAAEATDGSAQVVVAPPGEEVPASIRSGWPLSANSSVQAVTADETSACSVCTLGQACPLFTTAASAFQDTFGRSCPGARPGAETVDHLQAGVVGFRDPPGTAGDGVPSGGLDAANGVMTYRPGDVNGSWQETCTLPAGEQSLCTSSLDQFLARYGSR